MNGNRTMETITPGKQMLVVVIARVAVSILHKGIDFRTSYDGSPTPTIASVGQKTWVVVTLRCH